CARGGSVEGVDEAQRIPHRARGGVERPRGIRDRVVEVVVPRRGGVDDVVRADRERDVRSRPSAMSPPRVNPTASVETTAPARIDAPASTPRDPEADIQPPGETEEKSASAFAPANNPPSKPTLQPLMFPSSLRVAW